MMKNGPPNTLIMMDADTSYGAAIVLPMVSASRNVNAPNKALNGTNALWSLPTRILPICGTISPKKLITPATAVEILASNTAISEITIRIALTLIPREEDLT